MLRCRILGTGFMLPKGEAVTCGMGTVEDEHGDYATVWWRYPGPLVNCYRMAREILALKPGGTAPCGAAVAP